MTTALAKRSIVGPTFEAVMVAIIVANAVVLGLQTYVDGHQDLFDGANTAFLWVYIAEIAIRLQHAGSVRAYARDRWNMFDAAVVAVSIIPGIREVVMLLRLARLVRIVKVMRYLPELQMALRAVAKAMPSVASLAAGLALLIFLYGMVGVYLFGNENPDFENIGDAMLTMFMLLSLENLPDYMHTNLAITGWAVPYFVSYVIIGALLVFNLFIGVVLNAMEESRSAKDTMGDMNEAISAAQAALADLATTYREYEERGMVTDWTAGPVSERR